MISFEQVVEYYTIIIFWIVKAWLWLIIPFVIFIYNNSLFWLPLIVVYAAIPLP